MVNITSVLSHHMMSIYPIVRMQLSFVQFLLLCYKFCILSKQNCKSIYYHLSHYHESSFRKLARNKWICREICDSFFVINYVISHQFNYLLNCISVSIFLMEPLFKRVWGMNIFNIKKGYKYWGIQWKVEFRSLLRFSVENSELSKKGKNRKTKQISNFGFGFAPLHQP